VHSTGRPQGGTNWAPRGGARPVPLHFPGAEHGDAFMELEHLPDRILMVGGGYMAAEFSHIAARAGAAKFRCGAGRLAHGKVSRNRRRGARAKRREDRRAPVRPARAAGPHRRASPQPTRRVYGLSDCHLQRTGHLVGAGDQLEWPA
jgi:hypothetical protein